MPVVRRDSVKSGQFYECKVFIFLAYLVDVELSVGVW